MRGTNERRSVVDDGWEPLEPERPPLGPILAVFAVAMVVLPICAFAVTYLLASR